MASTIRQSTAGPTPSRSRLARPTPGPSHPPSQRGGVELPTYEPPEFSMTPAAQRALAALARTHDVQRLNGRLGDAQMMLINAAAEVNDRLTDRSQRVKRVRERRGEDDGEDETLAELERQVAEMRDKVNKMTSRMEETMRKLVDGKHNVKHLGDAAAAAAEDALAGNDTSRPRRGRRAAMGREENENEDSNSEDNEIEDFQPTDPAASTQAELAPIAVFRSHLEECRTFYQSRSLHDRYAADDDYVNFRRTVHDAQHPDDEDVPLPPREDWFNEDGTVALPGQTRRRSDEEGDSDDDLAIARATISTKCPLTLQEFKEPVTSTKCPHSFEKAAIRELFGHRPTVQCPVGGCTEMLSRSNLQVDTVLLRRIRRLQKARQLQEEDSDGENDDYGHGSTQKRSHIIDSDALDIDEIDDGNPPSGNIKAELRSTGVLAPTPSRRSQPTRIIDMGDSDEDAMEGDTTGS